MKPKILIVDDEYDVCEVLSHLLISKGYDIIIANSGQEALSKITVYKPSLVLLDIRMPNMDGIECLRKIKKLDKDVLVIMVSCITDMDTAKKALELGATDYLTKPLSLEAVETAVTTYLFLNSAK